MNVPEDRFAEKFGTSFDEVAGNNPDKECWVKPHTAVARVHTAHRMLLVWPGAFGPVKCACSAYSVVHRLSPSAGHAHAQRDPRLCD